jgi:prepilin-type N-terminal cleavage/methylation domain-containing protein
MPRARGFTLLEALVTLVIVSMLMAVLVQALLHVMGLRERVLRLEAEARTAQLHEAWFRDSVAALVVDPFGRLPGLSGNASGFQAIGAGPLARAGGVQPVVWGVDDAHRVLRYREGEDWSDVLVTRGGLRFQYRDLDGGWHDAWPVRQRPQERLPRAVALGFEGGDGPRWWIAAVASRPPRTEPAEGVVGDGL